MTSTTATSLKKLSLRARANPRRAWHCMLTHAMWGKGKSFGKGKGFGKPADVRPQSGMIDCGAKASAAAEAVVQRRIAAVLTRDKGAKIEIEQTARPYFRFGNGRAICRVHISSTVSGQHRSFSLYTLPNPDAYYQSDFEKSSLVSALISMDFLGPSAAGMMIDFATGLAMNTKEESPDIYVLSCNRKGHYVLAIVQYLTRPVMSRRTSSCCCPSCSCLFQTSLGASSP